MFHDAAFNLIGSSSTNKLVRHFDPPTSSNDMCRWIDVNRHFIYLQKAYQNAGIYRGE